MRMMASLLSVVLLAALMMVSGCKTSEVGVKKGLTGDISGYIDALPPQVVAAAEAVAKDMELTIDHASSSQLDGEVRVRTAKGKKIKVDINRYGDNISAVNIKVGTFGDQRLSLQYYNAIRAKLANRSRSVSPPSTSELNLLN